MGADYTPTLGNYTELKPFRYWCQKVLPLVYDDSLSYYELLCKVVDYLNKTMEDVETLHDDVDNLHTAYEQLQEYVNDYFDNLDVQEEINNKLDALASDGTLTSLLQPYIPDAVASWLTAHITPTTPAIDNSLSVSGAGADALITGNRTTFYGMNKFGCRIDWDTTNKTITVGEGWISGCGRAYRISTAQEIEYTNFNNLSLLYYDVTTGNVDITPFITPLPGLGLAWFYVDKIYSPYDYDNIYLNNTKITASNILDGFAKFTKNNTDDITKLKLMSTFYTLARFTGSINVDTANSQIIIGTGYIILNDNSILIGSQQTVSYTDISSLHVLYYDTANSAFDIAEYDSAVTGIGVALFGANKIYVPYSYEKTAYDSLPISTSQMFEGLAPYVYPVENLGLNLFMYPYFNKFYDTHNATINLNNYPQDISGTNYNTYCKMIPCSPGDDFYICGAGMSLSRLYAFVDGLTGTVNVIENAPANFNTNNTVMKITAPATAQALIVNFKDTNKICLIKADSLLAENVKHISIDMNNYAKANILVIGNSFSEDEYDYVPPLLKELAPWLKFNFGILYKSGATLSDQYNMFINNTAYERYSSYTSEASQWTIASNTKTMSEVLKSQPWNIIILHQASPYSMDYTTYQPYLNNLIKAIKNIVGDSVKIVLNLPHAWGENDPRLGVDIPETTSDQMYAEISEALQTALVKSPVYDVIPNGTAIQNARTTALGNLGAEGSLVADNMSHLQEGIPCLIPAYLGFLKIIEYIDKNKVNIYINNDDLGIKSSEIIPSAAWISAQNIPGQNGTSVGATSANALIAADCAIAAYEKHYEITDLS